MVSSRQCGTGRLAALIGLILAVSLTSVVQAQLAPTGGHYAARASDTGFAGAVNSQGGYGASVPLDLPAVRGGLPLLVGIVSGGHTTGAAGLGWDMPLSFVRRDTTVAHRRPINSPDLPPQIGEQISVVIEGQRTDLVQTGDTVWVPRRNGPQLEVHKQSDSSWVMYDGNGLTYTFATVSSLLAGADLWLLQDVTGPGGNHVHLDYDVENPTFTGIDAHGNHFTYQLGVSIDLTAARYNISPDNSGCYKNQVLLNYEPDPSNAAALSWSTLGNLTVMRVHKLASVDVNSKATCADTSYTALRSYQLAYQPDRDTNQLQLHAVTMVGQKNTDENAVTLPVATYTYGSVSDSNGSVTYAQTQTIPLTFAPAGVIDTRGIASTFSDPQGIPPADPKYTQSQGSVTVQNLVDINGDGRPELTYVDHGQLRAMLNQPQPDGAGAATYFPGNIALSGGASGATNAQIGALETRSSQTTRDSQVVNGVYGGYNFNTDMTWRQLIDVNGDGRLDIIDAKEEAGSWVVYLNTPAPNAPLEVLWQRRTISIAPMVKHLTDAGYEVSSKYLPLSQRQTGAKVQFRTCWVLVQDQHLDFIWQKTQPGTTFDDPNPCIQPSGSIILGSKGPESTTVEWELSDINGDGYPDFVFNSVPTKFLNDDPDPFQSRQVNTLKVGTHTWSIQTENVAFKNATAIGATGFTDINVMLNVAGIELDTGTSAFSAPLRLASELCGVERWNNVAQICGFADFNGDGLPDRFENGVATLNTGSLSGSFFSNHALIPVGFLASHDNPQYSTCNSGTDLPVPPSTVYLTSQLSGFRDLNGDGILDHVHTDGAIGGVEFGTGVGFGPTRTIVAPGAHFPLSEEMENCGGTRSDTTTGLFDIDGDGQPDIVAIAGTSLIVSQLASPGDQNTIDLGTEGFGVPQAGRLIAIDNGYGAVTHIGYQSAKQNALHSVPFPEIVAGAEVIADASGTLLESSTRHAYHRANLIFDPAYDAFVFPGYQRSVTMRQTIDADPTKGIATITDTAALVPFDESNTALVRNESERFKRYLKVGKVSDVTTLAGNIGTDPWALLSTNIANDARVIAGAHYEWDTVFLGSGREPNEFCVDMVYPYEFLRSRSDNALAAGDQCAAYGFSFQHSALSWRGNPGTTNPFAGEAVATMSTVDGVDRYGRVTAVTVVGDLFNNPTLCTQTAYATPNGTGPRVLNAPASRAVTNCGAAGTDLKIYADESWEYDGLSSTTDPNNPSGPPLVPVSNGFVTGHTVSRLISGEQDDPATGTPVDPANPEIREFTAAYDSNGNLTAITRTRDDGAKQTVQTIYDLRQEPFALAPTSVRVTATNADGTTVPAMTTTITRDALTLNAVNTSDPNGTRRGNTFDGFNRVLLSEVSPLDGPSGVLSAMTYTGFAVGETGGRSVAQQVFTEPVAPSADGRTPGRGTGPGRTSTVFLDSLGRQTRSEVQLGADYANQTLIVGRRTYDGLGRVAFEADPFVSTDSFNTPYGTSQSFNADGTLLCVIRGKGASLSQSTDEANETYPTCVTRTFLNHTEEVTTSDAASLLTGSPQRDVKTSTFFNALGRPMASVTVDGQPAGQATIYLGRTTYTQDPLGHVISMTRYLNPAPLNREPSVGSNAVTTTWRYDSLGWVTELDEQGNAPQFRSLDSWGELTRVQRCDDGVSMAPCPASDRRTITRYDALGRIVHSEDRSGGTSDTDGTVDADTVNDFTYDTPATFATRLTPTNVLGRLASATAPTLRESLSYDGLGRLNGHGYDDRHGNVHIVKNTFHGDGSLQALHLLLNDTSFKDEQVAYAYDSAGRPNLVTYTDGTLPQTLYSATGSNALDVFGRILNAQYGATNYSASYAPSGRRLLTDMKLAGGTHSRELAFIDTTKNVSIGGGVVIQQTVRAFDPVGRERSRNELIDGVSQTKAFLYDAIGQLASTTRTPVSATVPNLTLAYDALGNVLTQTAAAGTSGVKLIYPSSGDLDRLCGIAYGGAPLPIKCNVQYDGAGSIVSEPAGTGTRTFTYSPNGRVKTIVNGSTNATFKYDAFGAVQQLTVNTPTADARLDRHIGPLIKQRTEGGISLFTRQIPVPGTVATRHGKDGPWTFAFSEGRGNRFVTDQNGAFVQDLDYQAYGESSCVAPMVCPVPGTPSYTSEQWNDGDALVALGVSQLGARIYDPVIGRFTSRDPLIIPRSAAKTNPYAFAVNDPVNHADPTGLDDEVFDPGATRSSICWFCASSGSGASSNASPNGSSSNNSGAAEHKAKIVGLPTTASSNNGHGSHLLRPDLAANHPLNTHIPSARDTLNPPPDESARGFRTFWRNEGIAAGVGAGAVVAVVGGAVVSEGALALAARPAAVRGIVWLTGGGVATVDAAGKALNGFSQASNLVGGTTAVNSAGVEDVIAGAIEIGETEINVLSEAHGWINSSGSGLNDQAVEIFENGVLTRTFSGEDILAEDLGIAYRLERANPGVIINVFSALDPTQFNSFAQKLATGSFCVGSSCYALPILQDLLPE